LSRFPVGKEKEYWEDVAYNEGYSQGFNGVADQGLPNRLRGREKTLEAFVMGRKDGQGDKAVIDAKLRGPWIPGPKELAKLPAY
jgi:hypothetical protein